MMQAVPASMLPFAAYPFPQFAVELSAMPMHVSAGYPAANGQCSPPIHAYCESLASAAAAAAAMAAAPPNLPRPTHLGKSFTIEAILGLDKTGKGTDLRDCLSGDPSSLRPFKDAEMRRKNRLTFTGPYTLSQHQTKITLSDKDTRPRSEDPSACGKPPKSKRVRTIFTPEQLERLESEFERQQYMVGPERLYLASALNLTEAQVKVWFQNRRIKWRKQHLEMQQARLAKIRGDENQREIGEESEDSTDEENE